MRDRCIYFNGTLNAKCEKGVYYLVVANGIPLGCYPDIPCMRTLRGGEYKRLNNCLWYKPHPKYSVLIHELYWKIKNLLNIRYAVIHPPFTRRKAGSWSVEYFINWSGAWNASGTHGIITYISFLPFNYIKHRFFKRVK